MGYNSKNRDRRRRGGADFPFHSEPDISAEKKKARDLRQSAWWKRKISAGKCHYCGGTFHPSELTMDHKIPLARGGHSDKINLVPACKECNNKKKYMLPTEWDEYMEFLKK
ncbi:MAG TPA: HNH endonuclease signature motif containing protein [Spirochaetota bacterium]|nr:HNH endonuclease signature motif containing protein [Spirochaetota bacterium]HSA15850.1 HNH endonuclease signature motif containing protein [Spirochaetota bacterium]